MIRIFLNVKSAHRLMETQLAIIGEKWQDRRYLDMRDFSRVARGKMPSERKKDKVDGNDL
ncbi:hypothetical protein D6833_11270 [Candidatus Parcubacteria bacterium]|nr:MAG: hypothetical protein D6833_11270 [Candidatus Parcubacteria bacterium]